MTVISPLDRSHARAAAVRRGPAVRTAPGQAPAVLPADEPLDPLVGIALALVGGLLLGVAAQVLQGVLPGAWRSVATSVAVWSLIGAGLGSRVTGRFAPGLVGVVTLLALTGGYSAAASLQGVPAGPGYLLFWSLSAVVGGVVFGTAGAWCRFGSARERVAAAAVLGGVLCYEGLVRTFVFADQVPEGLTMVVLGIGAPLLVGRTTRERAYAGVALVPATALGLTAYLVLDLLPV
ncbi:DUF6518 family protein [Cellulomonas sp. NS3]|uniref:DUF6518 family protein n=1 Tax=Cellulomonas sp. NS3 TaxID=2973977 RepID=UPI002161D074|nr:DUF6518 family protein [Cellulomonas sp. NS3]